MFYRSQFWRLQKRVFIVISHPLRFIGHNFGDYKNRNSIHLTSDRVLSVTILETTKTIPSTNQVCNPFYRSQFWRLQKPKICAKATRISFIGHNFGDYKNPALIANLGEQFYRSQFWRLQKPRTKYLFHLIGFIGHNFGDYKNQ